MVSLHCWSRSGQSGRWADREMGSQRDGQLVVVSSQRSGQTGRWADREMGRQRDGQ